MFPTPWGHRHGRHDARRIEPGAFRRVPSLRRLDLAENQLVAMLSVAAATGGGNGAVMTDGIGEYFWGGFECLYFLSDGGDDALLL